MEATYGRDTIEEEDTRRSDPGQSLIQESVR